MEREFDIGDRILCTVSGVVGKCISFYTPTACEEQTMVLTDDGRLYHAPTSTWVVYIEDGLCGYEGEEFRAHMTANQKLLNPYGEYVIQFATNHGMSIAKAMEHPMVRARLAYFQETGM